MRDNRSNIKVVLVIEPGVYSGKAEGQAVDTAGYDSLTFAISMAEGGTSSGFELAMEHSEDAKEWELVHPDNVLGEAGLDARSATPEAPRDSAAMCVSPWRRRARARRGRALP
jgi:hypothetical protein